MEKKINFVNKAIYSFNPKKYNLLNKETLLKTFLYVILLSILIGIFQGSMNILLFNKVENYIEEGLKEEKYDFELTDGVLDFKNSPIKYDEGQLIILFDTTKQVDSIKSLNSIIIHKDNAIVLMKDGLYIRSGDYETTVTYNDLGLGKLYLNNDLLIKSINTSNVFKFSIIPISIIFKFIDLMIYALVISLFGVVGNILSIDKIKYRDIFKMSVYASTVPTIFSLLFPIGRLTMLIGGVILIFGLNNIREFNKKCRD